ncbi:MAG: YibE/F family protein [Defluviitaleaceae bacterium]|nr:YibE/F family protein [Defluviitaleaceae bacterium]
MKSRERIFYLCVLAASALFLFVGSRVASRDFYTPAGIHAMPYFTGVVTDIIDRAESEPGAAWGVGGVDTEITFGALISRGERRGDEVIVRQLLADFFLVNEREVSVGDRILIVYDDWNSIYHFAGYVRINHIIILGAVFLGLIILFARKKGFNAIVALGFTCMAVFWVFIPAILSGRNIYITAIIICVFSVVSTLLIVIGPNKKALSAMLGCLGGVLLAGILMLLMDAILHLTGAPDQETEFLLLLPTEYPINLRAIVFAGVILGAVGAIMDVAMSIASSLQEVKDAGGGKTFADLFKSGINIGKDILGTMLNTLILAYIGSSLSIILLLTADTASPTILFNTEMIIVEFLRALVGSFGMLLTVPLTAAICAWLYVRNDAPDDSEREYPDDYAERMQKRREGREFKT